MLLERERTTLLLIDIQERLLPAMAHAKETEARAAILIQAAKALDVPLAVSEQYPKGLGHTVPALREEIGNAPVFEKTAFSCWRDAALKKHLIGAFENGRPQVLIAGIEAHVCVLQTAATWRRRGWVFVAADAVSSRKETSVSLAFDRMRQAGVAVVNTEMAVFEMLGGAGSTQFRSLSALIR
ncbi:MAG: hydrolase [Rhizobiales bacterium]|nr:hydrolase [Hyphomicrobiales bacterium]